VQLLSLTAVTGQKNIKNMHQFIMSDKNIQQAADFYNASDVTTALL